MKKGLIIFLLVLLSPIIIIACILLYIELIRPIIWSIQYYPNRERSCTERADPVRTKINNISLSIPADYYPYIPTKCAQSHNCAKVQKRKSFGKNEFGQEIQGYCQNENDPPFYGHISLLFARNGSKGLPITLTANDKPDILYNLQKLSLSANIRNKERLCNLETSKFTIFDNPVILNCTNRPHEVEIGQLGCHFKAMIGRNVIVSSWVSTPKEYYKSYFQETEKFLLTLLDEKPQPSYDNICARYKD